MTPEEAVRTYYTAYSEGRPELFKEVISDNYVDYGHTPPGRGLQGVLDDYEGAVKKVGGVIHYDIDGLVAADDNVAVAWTGHLPNGAESKGLSLYQVTDGKVTAVHHVAIGALPGSA